LVTDLLRALAATGRVMTVSVGTWDMALDPDGHAQAVAQAGLNALFGR